MNRICNILREYDGSEPNLKSIYSDINALLATGLDGKPFLDIEKPSGKRTGYTLNSRTFSLDELKLLVDSVQSSRYLTDKQARELVDKLGTLCDKEQARELRRNVIVSNRIRSAKDNDSITKNLSIIQQAIAADQQITFMYYEYVLDKSFHKVRQYHRNKKIYHESPWCVVFNEGFYYLKAYDQSLGHLATFRIDRMAHVYLSDDKRDGKEAFEKTDKENLTKYTFSMYAGEVVKVELVCRNEFLKTMIDRFGDDLWATPANGKDGYFKTTVKVAISPAFFGWIDGLEDAVKIVGPNDVVEKYREHLEKLIGKYER